MAYELGTAKTLEEVMDARTNDFDELETQQLETQWEHKISAIPESEGITTRWWDYTAGVTRSGPEAQIPTGEDITTKQSGEYIVGVPALAGFAYRVEGAATSGSGDDSWAGYTDRLEAADSADNGAGVGHKYFTDGEGDAGGAEGAGEQEYVWFKSGVSGVSDLVIPRDQWNGDDLSDIVGSDENLFHMGVFGRLDFTFYNQGCVHVNVGIKTDDGDLKIRTLHNFNVKSKPMWTQSDLKIQVRTEGVNLNSYLNAAHFRGGKSNSFSRRNGSGRDGTVMGSGVTVSQGTPVPLISIKSRPGWENVNLTPTAHSAELDESYYIFLSIGSDLTNATFEAPNSEVAGISPSSSEYAVLVDNDADGFNDVGEIEYIEYVESGGRFSQSASGADLEGLSLAPGQVATLGVVPVNATTFSGASLGWGGNF